MRLLEEATPPAPGLGKGLACRLPGTRGKPSVSSEQAATQRKHQKGSQATPACAVTGGVARRVGRGESPAAASSAQLSR